MGSRIETFRLLRDTYADEIRKHYDAERRLDDEIKELQIQLEIKQAARRQNEAERKATINQLEGIRTVIRTMEDRDREEKRRREDNTIATTRAQEDGEYDEV